MNLIDFKLYKNLYIYNYKILKIINTSILSKFSYHDNYTNNVAFKISIIFPFYYNNSDNNIISAE